MKLKTTKLPKLFCLPNQSTAETFREQPWTYSAKPPAAAVKNKDTFKSWSQKPTTKHCFFSGYEGINPHLRISEQNPPHLLHAIVADYDSSITDKMLGEVDFGDGFPWTAVSRTFSGHRRAIWVFEEPLLLHSVQLTKKFLERAAKALHIHGLLPGLDKEALLHPAKYYEAGTDWKIGHDLIPPSAVNLWMMEASQKHDWSGEGTQIPIGEVATEVERKFPGRWQGDFQLGARGCRFWDDAADNPTAAIVRETGMQCFTGPKSFVPWSEILGGKFVKRFEEERLGGALDGVWFDGRDYWAQNPANHWVSHNLQSVSRHLRVKKGLSAISGKKETSSEVDRALVMIEDHQRIAGALPLVHQEPGITTRAGRRFLNTSVARVVQPATGVHKWGTRFPWLAGFFDDSFEKEAREVFLAWLQRFYVSALQQKLVAGQAIFVAGDVDQGKSFLTTVILGELMGGHQDASSYLLGESNFNKELFESALWCIDDSIPNADSRRHALYSAMIKKMVANRVFEYHAKFRDATAIPWVGRVATTLNIDEESARIMPDMEMNTLDKIMLFKMRTVKNKKFPANPTATVIQELPHFAAWLRDWEAPEHTKGGARFGVRAYHDKSLLELAKQSSDTAHFAELLDCFRQSYFKDNDEKHWTGSATELYNTLCQDPTLRDLARTYNTRMIGRNLARLMAQGARIKLGREAGGGGRKWTIWAENARTKKEEIGEDDM